MSEVLTSFPGARRALFARYHVGGCSSCGFQPTETLAEVCARNENLPVDEVIDHLQTSHEADLKLEISPRQLEILLAEALDEDTPLHLVDLRTREEYEAVALPGAQLFSQEMMQSAFATWNKNDPVVLYDHSGSRALDAAAYFAGHGFTHVKALAGGIDRYSLEVDPSLPRYEVEFE
ncbi:MAG: rhodanese-like domain-containing protein [Verrucomicrobiales bacterium]